MRCRNAKPTLSFFSLAATGRHQTGFKSVMANLQLVKSPMHKVLHLISKLMRVSISIKPFNIVRNSEYVGGHFVLLCSQHFLHCHQWQWSLLLSIRVFKNRLKYDLKSNQII
jgi:hypothetical protein